MSSAMCLTADDYVHIVERMVKWQMTTGRVVSSRDQVMHLQQKALFEMRTNHGR